RLPPHRYRRRERRGAGPLGRAVPGPLLQAVLPQAGEFPHLREGADLSAVPIYVSRELTFRVKRKTTGGVIFRARNAMPFTAALSPAPQAGQALAEVCAEARPQLDGTPDLAVVFFSPHHLKAAGEIGRGVRRELAPRCLLGCVGEAVIGNDREVEGSPAPRPWLAPRGGSVT